MKTDSFTEQYKHPKWQKMRLKILERDEYSCKYCGASESELHVHHLEYRKCHNVWEYEEDNFITLCKPCHAHVTDVLADSRRKLHNSLYFECLCALRLLWITQNNRESMASILALLYNDQSMISSVRKMLTKRLIRNAPKTSQTGTKG